MFKSFPHTKVFYTHQQEGSRQHFYNKVPREIQKEKNYIKILKHFKNSFHVKLILVFAPETKLNFVYRNIFCDSMYWKLSKSWLENNYIRSPTTGGEKMLCNTLRMRKVIFFLPGFNKGQCNSISWRSGLLQGIKCHDKCSQCGECSPLNQTLSSNNIEKHSGN